MPGRYEFGFGYGEIYRRRMRGQEEMRRRSRAWLEGAPREDLVRLGYESDYYGFYGSGSRPRSGRERRGYGREFSAGYGREFRRSDGGEWRGERWGRRGYPARYGYPERYRGFPGARAWRRR